jgi:hypothetical protein
MQLTNSFHKTSATIRLKEWMVPQDQSITWCYIEYRATVPYASSHKASLALYRRVKNKLCGIKGCTCGVVRN